MNGKLYVLNLKHTEEKTKLWEIQLFHKKIFKNLVHLIKKEKQLTTQRTLKDQLIFIKELLSLMRGSGCRQVLVGLESPNQSPLEGVELHANFKARRAGSNLDAVRRIQDHGITANGCFILGLDRHTPDIFEEVYEFALKVPLYDVQITILTPFPGTPLYDRLLAEGRILEPERWDLCTLFDVNYRPQNMTVEELRAGIYWLAERLYTDECLEQRRRPFFEHQWRSMFAHV